jgi:hypothetical protein
MSRGTRVLIGILAIFYFFCCVAGLGLTMVGARMVGKAIIVDPTRIASVSREIADYEVPPGFEESFASDIAGLKMVVIGPISPQQGLLVFMMTQFPAVDSEAGQREIERQLQRALMQRTAMGNADMQVVGQQEVLIKGEPVAMTVSEGDTPDGQTLRQLNGIFQGNQGPAILMILGESQAWDDSLVDDFMASIQ